MIILLLFTLISAITYTPTSSTCFNSTSVYGLKTSVPLSDLSQLRSSSFNPVSYAKVIRVCGSSNAYF